jgi:hypothetical protein
MGWSLLGMLMQQAEQAVLEFDEIQLRRILDQLLPEFESRDTEVSATVIPFAARPS